MVSVENRARRTDRGGTAQVTVFVVPVLDGRTDML